MIFPPIYDVRPIKNLKDMIEQSSTMFAEKIAFNIKCKDNTYKGIKYSEFKNDIDALGTALLDLNLKNSFIAVIGENRYEWCVTYLSVVNGVGVIVPLDKELPNSDLENLLNNSNANAIVYSGRLFHDRLKELSPKLISIKYYINMDIEEHENDSFLSFKCLVKKGRELLNSGNKDYIDSEIDENALSALIYTSSFGVLLPITISIAEIVISTVILSDIFQPITSLLNKSSTPARYSQPSSVHTYVISPTYFSSGFSASKSCSRRLGAIG